jgi:hypothetical protein
MRRVLLITYHYPPRPAVGGLRQLALAKYLPSYRWEAIVLTPHLSTDLHPAGRIIETGYRDVLNDFKAKFAFNPTVFCSFSDGLIPERLDNIPGNCLSTSAQGGQSLLLGEVGV